MYGKWMRVCDASVQPGGQTFWRHPIYTLHRGAAPPKRLQQKDTYLSLVLRHIGDYSAMYSK